MPTHAAAKAPHTLTVAHPMLRVPDEVILSILRFVLHHNAAVGNGRAKHRTATLLHLSRVSKKIRKAVKELAELHLQSCLRFHLWSRCVLHYRTRVALVLLSLCMGRSRWA